MAHLVDLFGESEHRSFLGRILNILEYYRKKIASLVIYVPIGEILISCFNWIGSFLLKYAGFRVEPIFFSTVPLISIGVVSEDSKTLVLSEEEKQIRESFKEEMIEEQKRLEQSAQQLKEDCETFVQKLEKKKALYSKKVRDLREKACQEQEEKKKTENPGTKASIDETAEQFGKLLSRERASETDRQNVVELNQKLNNTLDNLESEEESEPTKPIKSLPRKKKLTKKI